MSTEKAVSLIPLKLHYFCNGFGGAPILPFLPVIMLQLGFPGSALGLIFGFTTICMQFIMPVVARLVDRYPEKKQSIFRTMVLGGMICFYLIRFVPQVDTDTRSLVASCDDASRLILTVDGVDPCLPMKLQNYQPNEVACHYVCSDAADRRIEFDSIFQAKDVTYADRRLELHLESSRQCTSDMKCLADCHDNELNSVLNKSTDVPLKDLLGTISFWLVFLFSFGGMLCMSGGMSTSDSLTHQMVKGTKEDYGQQRVFASIGWGLSAMLTGYLVDRASADSLMYDYTVAFNILFVFWFADFVIVGFIMKVPAVAKEASKEKKVTPGLFQLLGQREVVAFFLFCITVGICQGSLQFHFILLEELGHHGADCSAVQALKLVQGLSLTFNCIGETPLFIYSGKLITKFGETKVMQSVLVLYTFRFIFYSQMTSPWQTLLIELMNGGCIALFFPAMISLAHKLAPEGSSTTMLAFSNTAFWGIGTTIGSTVAGSLSQSHGSSKTFFYFGMFTLLAFSLSALLSRREREKDRASKRD